MRCVVLGTPITHSLSPSMHNELFAACAPQVHFEAHDPGDIEGFRAYLDAVRKDQLPAADICGICVTIPYKQEAAHACDELTATAKRLDAVNCITRRDDGTLLGDNTDAPGAQVLLTTALQTHGLKGKGLVARIAGTGGVARALIDALARVGVHTILVQSRNITRAQVFCDERRESLGGLDVELIPVEEETAAPEADILVNATPLGLERFGSALPFTHDQIIQARLIFDAVYRDGEPTALIAHAQAHNVPTIDGGALLIEQGLLAQNRWNDWYHWYTETSPELLRALLTRGFYHKGSDCLC